MERWAIIAAHAIPEQETGLCSKCVEPQDLEAVSGSPGPRGYFSRLSSPSHAIVCTALKIDLLLLAYFAQGPAQPSVIEPVVFFKELFHEFLNAGLR